MSSSDQPNQPEDDRTPSADDVTDPTLQAEIANPADSNEPTGSTATDEPATAGDETGVEGVQGDDAVEASSPTAGAPSTAGDETGVEGVQGEDAVEPDDVQEAEPAEPTNVDAAAHVEPEPDSPTTAEQPVAADDPASTDEPALPNEAAAAPDDAVAEETPIQPEEAAADDAPPPDEPAQAELDEERAGVLAALRTALGDEAVVEHWSRERGDLWVRVRPQDWRAAAEAAKAAGFTYFCFLSAIDWLPSPFGKSEEGGARTFADVQARIEAAVDLDHGVTGGETRFQLLARVFSIAQRIGLVLKADLPEDGPVAETWTGVYPGANWHEREAHEMFGIGFAGHPYLVNLYLPGAFEGHPLRKDFPLLAREVKPWPGIVDVEAMPGEPEPAPDASTENTEEAEASA